MRKSPKVTQAPADPVPAGPVDQRLRPLARRVLPASEAGLLASTVYGAHRGVAGRAPGLVDPGPLRRRLRVRGGGGRGCTRRTSRLEEDRLCCLVIVGVRPDGTKELVALADGYRESTDSWAEVLRSLRDRGLAAPVLAVGDGALGFGCAARRVSIHPRAALLGPPHRQRPRRLAQATPTQAKGPSPRSTRHLTDGRARGGQGLRRQVRRVPQSHGEDHRPPRRAAGVPRLPLRALDPPADHQSDRVHLLDGAVSDQGHPRRRLTPGRTGMAYKLLDAAQDSWRRINGHELVPLVRRRPSSTENSEKGEARHDPQHHRSVAA